MKVLVDTSTLYSAIAFDGRISKLMELLIERHTMVISDYPPGAFYRYLSIRHQNIFSSG